MGPIHHRFQNPLLQFDAYCTSFQQIVTNLSRPVVVLGSGRSFCGWFTARFCPTQRQEVAVHFLIPCYVYRFPPSWLWESLQGRLLSIKISGGDGCSWVASRCMVQVVLSALAWQCWNVLALWQKGRCGHTKSVSSPLHYSRSRPQCHIPEWATSYDNCYWHCFKSFVVSVSVCIVVYESKSLRHNRSVKVSTPYCFDTFTTSLRRTKIWPRKLL